MNKINISILTFDGFNELDSLVAYSILNRIKSPDWCVQIASPTPMVQSMNGLYIQRDIDIETACRADAVIIGSGMKTRDIVHNLSLMNSIQLNPLRQLIAAQCSGTLILAKLGLIADLVACTDLTTKPWVEETGVRVLNQPFFAQGNVATVGGCLAAQYLACWIITKFKGIEVAKSALHYVAPVNEKDIYIDAMLNAIQGYI